MIESPEAIQRALLQEWSGVGGQTGLVADLRLVQEQGAEIVGEYLPDAVISAVNLSEVLCRGRSLGRDVAALPARLGHLGLRVEPFTTQDALLATEIFARDRRRVLSLADRCCLATAVRLGLPAVTDDRAWSTLDLDVEVLAFR